MADMGLFGAFPEEYGGMGGDYFALCLALEELGKVDQSVAITWRPGYRWAQCPCTGSATTRRSRNGCRS